MNKMKTKTLLLLALFVALSVLSPRPTQAKYGEKMEAAKERVQERKENREEKKEDNEEKRTEKCDEITKKIEDKVTNFDNTHKMHERQYALMKEKIGKVILEKSAAGKDVSKLRTDLDTLNGKIEKFNTDKKAFLDALKNTQQFACGQSEGAFKDALKAAQDKHKIVLADEKDIRNFYQNTIRADLKLLKD